MVSPDRPSPTLRDTVGSAGRGGLVTLRGTGASARVESGAVGSGAPRPSRTVDGRGADSPNVPLTPDDSAATSGSATEDAVRWMTVSPGWSGTPGGSGSTSRSLLSGASPGSAAAAPRGSGLPARAPSDGTSGPVSTGSWPAVAAPSSESEAVAARSSEGPSEGGVGPTPAGEGLPASGFRCSAVAAAATLLGGASAAAGVGVESAVGRGAARRHATTSGPRGPGSATPRRRVAGPGASTVASRFVLQGVPAKQRGLRCDGASRQPVPDPEGQPAPGTTGRRTVRPR